MSMQELVRCRYSGYGTSPTRRSLPGDVVAARFVSASQCIVIRQKNTRKPVVTITVQLSLVHAVNVDVNNELSCATTHFLLFIYGKESRRKRVHRNCHVVAVKMRFTFRCLSNEHVCAVTLPRFVIAIVHSWSKMLLMNPRG
uniref:Uncharacterized protein n=1 Tax=Steinernema glaseri TaxID=37863 RepID=A0A1I7ZPU9_9BILA